ncbi:hypothetical protein NMY22_g9844 [Coprinellus aureogranulatus]|nr:hypothetical protein NMY22_g9844 [Coprinellus aureogranulatus]
MAARRIASASSRKSASLFSITSSVELTKGGFSSELESKISRGAAHDSAERGPHAPKCDKGTREAVQDDILSWIDRGIEALLWLTGPAGTGKSAIAGSIADKCNEDSRKWLAGSFFFSDFAQQPDRYSKEYLFPTLAYHLMHLNIPGLREEILAAIDACPSVFDKRLDEQLRILILEPLRKIDQAAIKASTFKAIIVDGVDECKGDQRKAVGTEQGHNMAKEDNHREIISTLMHASQDPSFPFRVIIVSRPERAIERRFNSFEDDGLQLKRVFLDERYEPEADIELFLRARLDTIGRDHGLPKQWYLKALPTNWPRHRTRDVLQYLAQEASGQFIYAATVIRYIQDGTDTPHEQLKCVLDWKGAKGTRSFAALDALYAGILRGSPDPLLSVKWICSFHHPPFDLVPPWYQKAMLESSPGQTEIVLGKLTALVGLSDYHGQPAFTFYHKSLTDFLEDKGRSGDLHLDRRPVGQFLQERHYQVLKNRKPQGFLPRNLREFYRRFHVEFTIWVDLNRRYDASDVDWWSALLDYHPQRIEYPSNMFDQVHGNCHWSHCLPACRIWRRGILRHLKGIGYPIPTRSDLFKAKFPRWRHLGRIRDDRKTFDSWKAARAIPVRSSLESDDDSTVQLSIEDGPLDST